MGLSTGNSEQKTFVNIKGLKKGSEEIFFTKSVKKDGKWQNEGKFPKLEGKLRSMNFEEKEYDGNKYKVCNLEVVDDGVYILQFSLNSNCGRNIVNSILGQDKVNDIAISVYFNKNGYASSYVEVEGERAEWFLSLDEQKELVEITKNKKGEVVDVDRTPLISSFEKKLSSMTFNTEAKPVQSFQQAESELDEHMAVATGAISEEDEDDSLPF